MNSAYQSNQSRNGQRPSTLWSASTDLIFLQLFLHPYLYYSDIAFHNISGSRGDDGPGLEANERASHEVEGDAATGTVGRHALADQKDQKGHSSQYQDQGLARNR